MVELKWAYMGVIVKLSKFTIYAYTVNTKSNLGTPKCQFFPTFLVFSESVHQKEWENAQGDMKIGKVAKWDALLYRLILNFATHKLANCANCYPQYVL